MKEKLAKIISIILGPLWLPVLFIIVLKNAGLSSSQLKIIFPSVFFLQVIVPIIYVIIAPRLGWVSSWDMKERKERTPFFIFMLFLTFVSFLIITIFGNKILFDFNIIFIALLLTLGVINKVWKISLHASLNTGAAIIINFFYGWHLVILYLVIPVVIWSRLVLKRHTIAQLISGCLLTAFVTLFGLFLFGYI